MNAPDSSPEAHLPLTVPVFHILLSLSDSELHGYRIIADIAQRTHGDVTLTASTLYAALKRLLESGLVEELADRPDPAHDDKRRRYYGITSLGRDVLQLEAARLARCAEMARAKQMLPASESFR
jgi:DNA-binding PadR family transcriptional regulator